MIHCPNKSSKEFKELDKKLPDLSYYIWNKLGGEIDKEGNPIENNEEFQKILSKHENDYRKSYLTFLSNIPNTFNEKLNNDIHNILKEIYPNVNVEYTKDLPGIRGQYEAGNILINSLLQNTDTLPHEYAHHYIEMFLNSPIIKQGIILFGSKEKLVDAIGKETVRSMKWYQKFYDWIKGLFNSKQSLLNNLTNSFLHNTELSNFATNQSYEKMYQKVNKDDLLDDKDKKDIKSELTTSEKTLTDHLSRLDRMGELKDKAIKALQIKLEVIMQRSHLDQQDIDKANAFIERISKEESNQALITFTTEANRVTNRFYRDYLKVKQQLKDIEEGKSKLKKEDVFNPSILNKWRDYLASYNVVEDFRHQLFREGRLDEDPTLKAIINNVIEKKNDLRELYKSEGLDMDAEFLANNYNRVFNDFKSLQSKKYDDFSTEDKAKISKEDFVRAQTEFNTLDLHEQTILALRDELQRAKKDISLIGRWANTTANSRDAVIVSAYKAMSFAVYRAASKTLEVRDELVDHLRDLEATQGSSFNKKILYDYMLEKDKDGKYNTKIVNRFGGEFWKAREDFISKLKDKNGDEDTYKKEVSKWNKINAPLQIEDFNKAKWGFINELKDKGLVTEEEMNDINWNDLSRTPITYHELAEDGRISDNLADTLSHWVSSNIWNFREPTREWKDKNPQWKNLKNILDNPNDPRAKFYTYYIDKLDEKNSKLPHNRQLSKYQIPGIRKTLDERYTDKESIGHISKLLLSKEFNVLPDDIDRTTHTMTDEEGNIKHFIPTYYTNSLKKYIVSDDKGFRKEFSSKLAADKFADKNAKKGYKVESKETPEEQSYDLSSGLLKFTHMAENYSAKAEIFPEMELTKFFINNREIANTDNKGNIIKNLRAKFTKDKGTVKPKSETNLAEFFNDWYEMAMYGIKEKDQGSIFGIDIAKAADALNKYTAVNLLALNVRAGINHLVVRNALQTAEAFAGRYITIKSYAKADTVLLRNMSGIMNDIGSRKPTNLITKLYEHFNLQTYNIDTNLKNSTKGRNLAKFSNTLFLMTAGDFYIQSKMFLGSLENIRAYDSEGKDIGSMLDQYTMDKNTNKLVLNKEVNLIKSNWTSKDQDNWTIRTRGLIGRTDGEYGELERSALQRYAIGRMGLMFRRFVPSGVSVRYKKYGYSERLGDYDEGYYRSAGKFFVNLGKELGTMLFAIKSEKYQLNDMQKANVIKAFTEVSFAIASFALASFFLNNAKEGDDKNKFMSSWAAYQLLRFKSEMLFFTPKIDEAMSILRSPAASLSMFDNITNLSRQLGVDFMGIIEGNGPEIYKTGSHKGEYKMDKILFDWIPGARALYQFVNTNQQLNSMNKRL